jgi:membrane-associated protease RseP (regulator of RpoE activity)
LPAGVGKTFFDISSEEFRQISFSERFQPMWYLIAMMVFLAGSMTLHELGHYGAARLFRLVPPIFSVGLGPILKKYRAIGTEWRIHWIPLGGYCQVFEDDIELPRFFSHGIGKLVSLPLGLCMTVLRFLSPPAPPRENKNLLSQRGPLAEFSVGLGGPLVNTAAAAALFFAAFYWYGDSLPADNMFAAYLPVEQGRLLPCLYSAVTAALVGALIMPLALPWIFHQAWVRGLPLIGGPVESVEVCAAVLQGASTCAGGFSYGAALLFLGLINVAIAGLNIIPFPGFDGMRMVLAALRKTISHERQAKLRGWVTALGILLVGAALIVSLGREIIIRLVRMI